MVRHFVRLLGYTGTFRTVSLSLKGLYFIWKQTSLSLFKKINKYKSCFQWKMNAMKKISQVIMKLSMGS